MDRQAVAFARSCATRYVRTKHPHGLGVEDRRVTLDFMELLNWQKAAVRRVMSEDSFRRHRRLMRYNKGRTKQKWVHGMQ